jgi:ABC-type siderophore export system fused ATPase/permease subunit
MENKIYNDDVERVVNNGHERRKAKNMAKYEMRRKRTISNAILFGSVGVVFALFGIFGWLVSWIAFPLCFGFVMYATFLFGSWFEGGKRGDRK